MNHRKHFLETFLRLADGNAKNIEYRRQLSIRAQKLPTHVKRIPAYRAELAAILATEEAEKKAKEELERKKREKLERARATRARAEATRRGAEAGADGEGVSGQGDKNRKTMGLREDSGSDS